MKRIATLLCCICVLVNVSGQVNGRLPETEIMTLGVFHFAYHNLDVVTTADKDKISVIEEPYQSQIIAVAEALGSFRPTIIAIEVTPDRQGEIDSLYSLYLNDKLTLGKDEIYQLGFRMGKQLSVPVIYCVNDWGRPYENIEALFRDSTRTARLEDYFMHSPDSVYRTPGTSKKVSNIVTELIDLNDPEVIKERLSVYLLNPFKYEEQPGDFTGVDFETGRWFSRNLRIYRNIQRIPHTDDDRILLIIGRDHLNLLNHFFDVSREFKLVSPLPYLETAREK